MKDIRLKMQPIHIWSNKSIECVLDPKTTPCLVWKQSLVNVSSYSRRPSWYLELITSHTFLAGESAVSVLHSRLQVKHQHMTISICWPIHTINDFGQLRYDEGWIAFFAHSCTFPLERQGGEWGISEASDDPPNRAGSATRDTVIRSKVSKETNIRIASNNQIDEGHLIKRQGIACPRFLLSSRSKSCRTVGPAEDCKFMAFHIYSFICKRWIHNEAK